MVRDEGVSGVLDPGFSPVWLDGSPDRTPKPISGSAPLYKIFVRRNRGGGSVRDGTDTVQGDGGWR